MRDICSIPTRSVVENEGAMKPSEVLFRAAYIIRERGHAKYLLEDLVTGGVCLSGAIRCAISGSPTAIGVSTLAERMADVEAVIGLGDEWDEMWGAESKAVCWNNADDRTPAEVIAALDAAAVVALQEEGIEPGDVL